MSLCFYYDSHSLFMISDQIIIPQRNLQSPFMSISDTQDQIVKSDFKRFFF